MGRRANRYETENGRGVVRTFRVKQPCLARSASQPLALKHATLARTLTGSLHTSTISHRYLSPEKKGLFTALSSTHLHEIVARPRAAARSRAPTCIVHVANVVVQHAAVPTTSPQTRNLNLCRYAELCTQLLNVATKVRFSSLVETANDICDVYWPTGFVLAGSPSALDAVNVSWVKNGDCFPVSSTKVSPTPTNGPDVHDVWHLQEGINSRVDDLI